MTWHDFVDCLKCNGVFTVCLQEGLILVGGNSRTEVSISLNALSAKQQSIVGIPKGTIEQLLDLVSFVSEGKVSVLAFVVRNRKFREIFSLVFGLGIRVILFCLGA